MGGGKYLPKAFDATGVAAVAATTATKNGPERKLDARDSSAAIAAVTRHGAPAYDAESGADDARPHEEEGAPPMSVPASFVVFGRDIGYENTSLALLALYSGWTCAALYATVLTGALLCEPRWTPLYGDRLVTAATCAAFLWLTLIFADPLTAHSPYRRLTDSPQQPGICAAVTACVAIRWIVVAASADSTNQIVGMLALQATVVGAAKYCDLWRRHL